MPRTQARPATTRRLRTRTAPSTDAAAPSPRTASPRAATGPGPSGERAGAAREHPHSRSRTGRSTSRRAWPPDRRRRRTGGRFRSQPLPARRAPAVADRLSRVRAPRRGASRSLKIVAESGALPDGRVQRCPQAPVLSRQPRHVSLKIRDPLTISGALLPLALPPRRLVLGVRPRHKPSVTLPNVRSGRTGAKLT